MQSGADEADRAYADRQPDPDRAEPGGGPQSARPVRTGYSQQDPHTRGLPAPPVLGQTAAHPGQARETVPCAVLRSRNRWSGN